MLVPNNVQNTKMFLYAGAARFKELAVCSDTNKYKNINKSQTIKKLEKRRRRLQRSVSRKYEQNKKKGKYCKTNHVIKKEKLLLNTKSLK